MRRVAGLGAALRLGKALLRGPLTPAFRPGLCPCPRLCLRLRRVWACVR